MSIAEFQRGFCFLFARFFAPDLFGLGAFLLEYINSRKEEKNMKKSTKITIAVVAAIVVIAAFVGVYFAFGPKTTQGAKAYTVEVVDNNGESTTYEARTDAEYLRQALEELDDATDFALVGEESDYGLYITSVNGVTADYAADGAYWSIYVNGEYGMNGVDTQPVTDGDAYKLVYEVYSAE